MKNPATLQDLNLKLYNLYTKILQSNMGLVFGSHYLCSTVYGKVLLLLNLKSCQWSFNYFSCFLFNFNFKFRFCSYILGVYKREQDEVYLTILLDRNECFSLETEKENLLLFLHWLEFNDIVLHYFVFELNDIFDYKSENMNSFSLLKKPVILKNSVFDISSSSLSRESFFYIWFVNFFSAVINTKQFVYDFFEESKVEWYRNLKSWNLDVCFLLKNYSHVFNYYTISDFLHVYRKHHYQENFLHLNFDIECTKVQERFPRNEINIVSTPQYLHWFLCLKTSLIPISIFHLFNRMAFFSLNCFLFSVFYTHLTTIGPLIQHWFIHSFKLIQGIEFSLVFQTEENLKNSCLSFIFFVNGYFDLQKLKGMFFSYFIDFLVLENIPHTYLSTTIWSYYNRLLAGSYSLNWNVYNSFTETYTKICIDIDSVYSTRMLTSKYNPLLTPQDVSYQKEKSIYLVTRNFSGGIL